MTLPLVFLHGWGLHGGIWQETASRMPGREVRMPDLPGYGDAPLVAPYDPDGLADALMTFQPDPCILVGWSLGGLVAQSWAARRPDQVRALILVGTTPAFVSRPDWPEGMASDTFAQFAASLESDRRGTLLRFLSLQARGGDASREVIARLRESVFARGEPEPRALAAGLELLRRSDLRAGAARIAAPTLVVHGGHDTLCPSTAGTWLAEHIPGARLALHERASHAPFLSHLDWFVETVLGFIDRIEPELTDTGTIHSRGHHAERAG